MANILTGAPPVRTVPRPVGTQRPPPRCPTRWIQAVSDGLCPSLCQPTHFDTLVLEVLSAPLTKPVLPSHVCDTLRPEPDCPGTEKLETLPLLISGSLIKMTGW